MKIRLITIPNLLTLTNLFCGCLSLMFLARYFGNDLEMISQSVLILMIISLVADFLDGMTARMLKQNSPIGTELDSLADVVSFGVVPGLMMVNMLAMSSDNSFEEIKFAGLLITLFSALRLAKFNVDTEQSTYFKGLNTPANTLFIYGLFYIMVQNGKFFTAKGNFDLVLLVSITIISSLLLVSNLPIFSFKLKDTSWSSNHYKYVFLILSLVSLILFQLYALPFIIILYIIISILFSKKIKHGT